MAIPLPHTREVLVLVGSEETPTLGKEGDRHVGEVVLVLQDYLINKNRVISFLCVE